MKEVFRDYYDNKIKLEKWQIVSLVCLIIAISGFFGFVYEYIFYFFNNGMEKFYWRGGNFLPWINIYAIGSMIILLTTWKLRKSPLKVFLLSVFTTGVLEYFSGLAIYKIGNGLRYWDYNTEILNFGNIQGFICFRSVTFFGLSALMLMYLIVPFCIFLITKINKKIILPISVIICALFVTDELYNEFISKIIHTPNAIQIYSEHGFNFMPINK